MDILPIQVDAQFGAATTKPLAARFFVRPTKSSDAAAAENALTLVLAAVSRHLSNNPSAVLDKATSDILGHEGRKLYGLGLPQRTFSGLKLRRWEFEECDLRNALFLNCDLIDAKFYNCSMAGAVIVNCEVSEDTAFQNCDLSGIFVSCDSDQGWSSLSAAAFRDANLTSAEIRGPGVSALLAHAQEAGALTALLTLKNASGGDTDSTVEDKSANAEFYAALAARAHAADGAKFADILVTRSDGQRGQSLQRRDAIWARIPGSNPSEDAKLQVDRSREHGWIALARTGEGLQLRKWSDGELLSASPGVPTAPIAADCLSFRSSGAAMGLWPDRIEVCIDAQTGPRHVSIPLGGRVKATPSTARLLPAVPGEQPMLAALGAEDGTLFLWTLDGAEAGDVPLGFDSAITSIATTDRGDEIMTIQASGLVTGLRRLKNGPPQIVYRFQTAITDVARCIPLNRLGQMMIVGTNRDSPKGFSLCVLIGNSGTVAAVFPRRSTMEEFPLPYLLEDQAAVSTRNDPEAAMQAALASFKPKWAHKTVRPVADNSVAVELEYIGNRGLDGTANEDSRSPAGLVESFIQDGRSYYRTIQLRLEEFDKSGKFLVERLFLEPDLKLEEYRPAKPLVRFVNRYRRDTQQARAHLDVGYAGKPNVRRSWTIELEVEWDDNPFTGDGIPVSGDRFFGMRRQLGSLLTLVRERSSAIVMSRRRAGKTSFLHRAAEFLRNPFLIDFDLAAAANGRETEDREAIDRYKQQTALISVVVSAENMGDWGEDFVPQIKQKLDDVYGSSERFGLAGLSSVLSGRKDIEALQDLGGAVTQLGLPTPIVIFVDEWGHLRLSNAGQENQQFSDRFVNRLSDAIPKLQSAGIVLVASSVPADFPLPTTESLSAVYRYLKNEIDLTPMSAAEMEDMIRSPLVKRGWQVEPELVDMIGKLASGSPDDVNRLMHLAFKTAKETNAPRRTVGATHLDLAAAEQILIRKYDQQQGFIAAKMHGAAREKLLQDALSSPPPWDLKDIVIPPTGAPDPEGRRVFSQAGYRRQPTGRSDADWALWIPWGLTLCLRRLALHND